MCVVGAVGGEVLVWEVWMPDERVGGERGRCGERRGVQEGWTMVGGGCLFGGEACDGQAVVDSIGGFGKDCGEKANGD